MNYDNDASARVCYDFESGAVTTDAKTLGGGCGAVADTLSSVGLGGSATAQEGVQSANFSGALLQESCPPATCTDWDLSATNRFSVMAWIRPTATTAAYSFIIDRIGFNVATFEMYLTAADGGKLHLDVRDANCSTTKSLVSAAAIPLNVWTHVAATYDGANITLYVNGTALPPVARTGALCNTGITVNELGNNEGGPTRQFSGLMDEVRIFSRAFSPTETCGVCLNGSSGTRSPAHPECTCAPGATTTTSTSTSTTSSTSRSSTSTSSTSSSSTSSTSTSSSSTSSTSRTSTSLTTTSSTSTSSSTSSPTTSATTTSTSTSTSTSRSTTTSSSTSSTSTSSATSSSRTTTTSTSSSTSTSRSTSSSTSSSTSTSTASSTSSTSTTSTSVSSTSTTAASTSTSATATTSSSTTSSTISAVNYDDDASARVCYDFESGAVTADAKTPGVRCGAVADTLSSVGLGGSATAQEGVQSANFSGALLQESCPPATCTDWDLSATNRFSLMAWIRPTATTAAYSFVIDRIGFNVATFELYLTAADGGKLHLDVRDANCSTTKSLVSSAAIPLNVWTHVAATYDGANITLYVNGTALPPVARTGALCNTGITVNELGNNEGGSTRQFSGLMDEVRIFSRAFSATETCSVCRNGSNGARSPAHPECACSQ